MTRAIHSIAWLGTLILALNPSPYKVPQQFLKDAETQNYFIKQLHPFLRLAKQNIDTLNTLTEALTAADTALNTLITDASMSSASIQQITQHGVEVLRAQLED